MSEPTPLDPIEPTKIAPGLVAVPLTPSPWDDAEDVQHAVTPDGLVWLRRAGLWHRAPWWQAEDADQIRAICGDPDGWAYDNGWPRKFIEDAHGPLTPITLPGARYPHDDARCGQDSVDAEGFQEACRQIARLGIALGLSEGLSISEVVDAAIEATR